MRTSAYTRKLLISVSIMGFIMGTAHAQSPVDSAATQGSDSVEYSDFLVDSPAESQPIGWEVWTLSGLGVASLGIGTALYIVGRSDQASLGDFDRDNEGRIRNITQRNAARMEEDVESRLEAGRGYILGGIALGALAVAWYYLDAPEQKSVKTNNNIAPFGWRPKWDVHLQSESLKFLGKFSF